MEEKNILISFEGLDLSVSILIKQGGSEWIICLHGIQSGKELFANFLKQPFLQKYSLLAIDSIGFGNSSKPDNFSYDIADQAKIVEQLIRKLEIKKLHLVGHSLGGTISTIILKPLEESIVSFINLEGNLTLADSGLTKEIATYSFEEFKNEKYQQIKQNVKNSGETTAAFRSSCLEKIPDYVFYKTSLSIIKWAKNEELRNLFSEAKCKRLYVYGDKNAFKKDIAPDSTSKVEIPNAGHFMLLENPEASYQAIENFFKE